MIAHESFAFCEKPQKKTSILILQNFSRKQSLSKLPAELYLQSLTPPQRPTYGGREVHFGLTNMFKYTNPYDMPYHLKVI